jgi:hypothetical protein
MTDPAGLLSEPIVALRDLVAASPTFQAWVGAADLDAAKLRARLVVTENQPARPFALVDFGKLTLERYAVTNRAGFQHKEGTSTLSLWFEANAVGALDDEGEFLTFANAVGAIIEEVALSAIIQRGPGLIITEIDLDTPPSRVVNEKRKTEGDLLIASWVVTYTRQP